ncbi:hypothetical protein L1987_06736 [Smallanthus sonchifolius]|uniref:Uncharacterized protein n=1 Tax=Smallanthus sonchifolius TaxID=185202 RepID=A0ACB9JYX9_9ASTR|nr:hypothetical protein L1987_06736 [Smallanthus sonchifolius]
MTHPPRFVHFSSTEELLFDDKIRVSRVLCRFQLPIRSTVSLLSFDFHRQEVVDFSFTQYSSFPYELIRRASTSWTSLMEKHQLC